MTGPKEGELREYFLSIEEAFCRHRGAPLLLSPLDFEKAIEWNAAGIGPEVVAEGIRRYFERLKRRKIPKRRAVCLSFSEQDVLAVREERRAAAVGRSAGVEGPDEEARERIQAFLGERVRAVEAFLGDPERRGARPVLGRHLESVLETLKDLEGRVAPSQAGLEAALGPMDAEVGRLGLLETPPEILDSWREAARIRLGAVAEAMDEKALRSTVDRLCRQAAYRELGLPRLSMLFFEG